MASSGTILRLRQRTVTRVEVFLSRGKRQRVWRGFFARQTVARGETLCREEESEDDQDFVSRYVAMEVSPIWREEESETRGRPETAREERPIGLCQVVRGWAKMTSFLPHCQLCQNVKFKCKTIGYLNLSFLAN